MYNLDSLQQVSIMSSHYIFSIALLTIEDDLSRNFWKAAKKKNRGIDMINATRKILIS